MGSRQRERRCGAAKRKHIMKCILKEAYHHQLLTCQLKFTTQQRFYATGWVTEMELCCGKTSPTCKSSALESSLSGKRIME